VRIAGDRILPLAALLIAGERRLPRLMGSNPIESQLRRTRAAGAGHAVIFVERVTSDLLAIVDRLRREGLTIDIARTVADAAEYIHPDEAVLMIAPDVVVVPERLLALATSAEPVLLCVRDEPANDRFELIDPTARWTGFARIDGGLLRRTAAMVGDWDLASTLLRRAVQEGSKRMTLTPDEAAFDLLVVDTAAAAQQSGRRLIARTPIEAAGWGMKWLIAPVSRTFARVACDLNVDAPWVTLAGFTIFMLAGACALAGWVIPSLLLLLFAQIFDLSGMIGTHAAAASLRFERFRFPTRATVASVVVLGMGITLAMRSMQWGCVILALVIIGATWLAAPLARDDVKMSIWRSDPSGHAIIGLLGFAFGSPVWALAISAAHASVSLAWALRKTLAGLARS
jgi:hypothetical protein